MHVVLTGNSTNTVTNRLKLTYICSQLQILYILQTNPIHCTTFRISHPHEEDTNTTINQSINQYYKIHLNFRQIFTCNTVSLCKIYTLTVKTKKKYQYILKTQTKMQSQQPRLERIDKARKNKENAEKHVKKSTDPMYTRRKYFSPATA